MELSRQEYPALLTSLQPQQAVFVLGDRVTLIGRVNADIADWLAERRRIEDAYAQGLKRLAARRHDSASGLGVFQTPWQSVVASCESLAESHKMLSQRIEADVERPLREYQTKSREMQGISTVQGNLASLARDFDDAQKKVDKLRSKGAKSDTGKISSALSSVQEASLQWESQAPYIFEQLQALDEDRVNHLRDALTQLQTHEVDQLERSRTTAESTLNATLTVDPTEEISTFVARTSGGLPSLMSPRRASRPSTSNAASITPTPTTPIPPMPDTATSLAPPTPSMDDRQSEVSSVSGGTRGATPAAEKPKKSAFGGLKRFSTVVSRRNKDSKTSEKMPSPEKRMKQSRFPLKRGSNSRNMQQIPSPNASMTELPDTSAPQIPPSRDSQFARPLSRATSSEPGQMQHVNGDADAGGPNGASPSPMSNGAYSQASEPQERKTRPPSTIQEEGERDFGTSNVSSAIDDITRAQQEAAAADGEAPQFKLDIRNEPIREEDADAQQALSNMANTLRAQAIPPPRKLGTVRGRRDVRNTIYVPNPSTPEPTPIADNALNPASPFAPGRSSTEERAADAQSIRSSHSLNSLAPGAVRHPEMQQPGLNASIIETVSAWFTHGQISRATVIGELALVNNKLDEGSHGDVIRLENFPVLEKVAPNPTFVTQIPSRSGEYTLDLSQISRTQVAFKYQVHLEDSILASHAPVILSPVWKIEPSQASVILNYSYNPLFVSDKRHVSLHNVVVMINVEDAKATSCQSKPMGTFSKERNLIYWKLGDLNLEETSGSGQRLLARFTTEGEAKPGSVETRWEIAGEHALGVGSGLSLSQGSGQKESGTDPFADEGTVGGNGSMYSEVPVTRKMVSGKYVAS